LDVLQNVVDIEASNSRRRLAPPFGRISLDLGNFMPEAAGAATAKRRFSKPEKRFEPSF
jgi:hypothetical protein